RRRALVALAAHRGGSQVRVSPARGSVGRGRHPRRAVAAARRPAPPAAPARGHHGRPVAPAGLSLRPVGPALRRVRPRPRSGWATVAGVAAHAASHVDVSSVEDTGQGFHVHLDVFEGPFDLLLSLIARKQLDVTLVAISQVTDEFLAHIRARGREWDLDQASSFLVVAATLLDLKVARLLPSVEIEDEEDLVLLEARDLLFARLLQYRAYK